MALSTPERRATPALAAGPTPARAWRNRLAPLLLRAAAASGFA